MFMARKKQSSALLIIDMLNTLQFPEGRQLLKHAKPIAKNILRLKQKLKSKGVPIIYVNDNFGKWRSSWEQVYEITADEDCLGKPLAQTLKPENGDYFVLKPKHSGFYSTTLEVLLEELGTKKLIMTGIAGNICVLFTANDAHMRDFEVIVPRDCIASNTTADNNFALRQLREVFGMKTPLSKSL